MCTCVCKMYRFVPLKILITSKRGHFHYYLFNRQSVSRDYFTFKCVGVQSQEMRTYFLSLFLIRFPFFFISMCENSLLVYEHFCTIIIAYFIYYTVYVYDALIRVASRVSSNELIINLIKSTNAKNCGSIHTASHYSVHIICPSLIRLIQNYFMVRCLFKIAMSIVSTAAHQLKNKWPNIFFCFVWCNLF